MHPFTKYMQPITSNNLISNMVQTKSFKITTGHRYDSKIKAANQINYEFTKTFLLVYKAYTNNIQTSFYEYYNLISLKK